MVKKQNKVKVEDKFVLNSGVAVVVKEYNGCHDVLVADEHGNSRIVDADSLRAGSVSWSRFGIRDKSIFTTKYAVGTVWKSNKYGEFTIVEMNTCKDITIKWANTGHVQRCNSTQVASGSIRDESTNSWNYLNTKVGKSYVYFVTHKDRVVYIGKGYGSRYLHPTSGTSSNIELNRLYFAGESVVVSIFKDGLTDEEATNLEAEQIRIVKPEFNKILNIKT